jgi:hypothetical protein
MNLQAWRVDLTTDPPKVEPHWVNWRDGLVFITQRGRERLEVEFVSGKHAWFYNEPDARQYAADWKNNGERK